LVKFLWHNLCFTSPINPLAKTVRAEFKGEKMRKSLLCVLALSLASLMSQAQAADCVVELKSSAGQVLQQFSAANKKAIQNSCSGENRACARYEES
jgi:hypothetical protein